MTTVRTGISSPTGVATAAARVSVVASTLFLSILIALHLVKSELDPSWRMISEYEIGAHGWLMRAAFILLGSAMATAAVAVRPYAKSRAGTAGLVLLAVAAVGTVLAGLAVSDPITATKDELTTHGNLHGLGAMLGIPTVPIAAALITRALGRSRSPMPGHRVLVWAAALTWIGLAQFLIIMAVTLPTNDGNFGPEVPIGWPNRILILTHVAWLFVVAVQASTARPESS